MRGVALAAARSAPASLPPLPRIAGESQRAASIDDQLRPLPRIVGERVGVKGRAGECIGGAVGAGRG